MCSLLFCVLCYFKELFHPDPFSKDPNYTAIPNCLSFNALKEVSKHVVDNLEECCIFSYYGANPVTILQMMQICKFFLHAFTPPNKSTLQHLCLSGKIVCLYKKTICLACVITSKRFRTQLMFHCRAIQRSFYIKIRHKDQLKY